MRKSVVVLIIVVTGVYPACAQAPWNREVTGIAVVPAADGTPGAYDVHVAWTFGVEQNSTPLDLSTEVELLVNGTPVGSLIVPVSVAGGSLFCGDQGCSGSCGNSTVDGLANDLYCHATECDCRSLDWMSSFPTEPLMPGDEIMVILYPAPGALPDSDTGDDTRQTIFDGEESLWNRRIESVEITPSAGDPGTLYDVRVNWSPMAVNLFEQLHLGSEILVLVNGSPAGAADGCFDWILPGTGNACTDFCIDEGCGTTSPCFGAPVPTACKVLDEWCACAASTYDVVPNVPLTPGDILTVSLKPVPGALPELPGMGGDDEARVPVPYPGDMDCDGDVDFDDIDPFVLALTGEEAYLAEFPDCLWLNGDTDQDGDVDFDDIDAFVDLIGG